jgi:hypothetical protein
MKDNKPKSFLVPAKLVVEVSCVHIDGRPFDEYEARGDLPRKGTYDEIFGRFDIGVDLKEVRVEEYDPTQAEWIEEPKPTLATAALQGDSEIVALKAWVLELEQQIAENDLSAKEELARVRSAKARVRSLIEKSHVLLATAALQDESAIDAAEVELIEDPTATAALQDDSAIVALKARVRELEKFIWALLYTPRVTLSPMVLEGVEDLLGKEKMKWEAFATPRARAERPVSPAESK